MTARWRKKAEVYREYARTTEATGFVCDWSEAAAEDMFRFESTGGVPPKPDNGYAIGKGWLDVQLAMWAEDVKQLPPLVTWSEIPEPVRPMIREKFRAAARTALEG